MEGINSELIYLRNWMIICAIVFFVSSLYFLFLQNRLLNQLNTLSRWLFKDRFPPIPLSTEKFWLVLTTSMMVMLVVICTFVAVNPEKYIMMVVIMLFSKFCSSALYLVLFLRDKHFAYLAGTLTDGPIFIITLILWLIAI